MHFSFIVDNLFSLSQLEKKKKIFPTDYILLFIYDVLILFIKNTMTVNKYFAVYHVQEYSTKSL